MKLLGVVFRKSLRELLRDWLVLSLSLAFGPFFVLLYVLMFPEGSTTYTVDVLNLDQGVATADSTLDAGAEAVEALQQMVYADSKPILTVNEVADRTTAEQHLEDRQVALLVIIPEDFSRSLWLSQEEGQRATTTVSFVGDLTYSQYIVASVMAYAAVDGYVQTYTGVENILQLDEQALGSSGARSEIELYIPGLMIVAVSMMLFESSMVVTREVAAGTLRRLQMTPMTAWDYLGGTSIGLIIVSTLATLLTFLTALAVGVDCIGPDWLIPLIGAITSLSVIGVGLIIASFSKTTSQAFVIANFPLIFFMFFSGGVFPVPSITLFTIAGRAIGIYDIIPPRHAVNAINKVMTLGAGFSDITYELAALVVLTVIYFTIGVWIFNRRHLRAR